MKRFLALAALLAAPVFADGSLLPVHQINRINYDLATGEITRTDTGTRGPIAVWDASNTTGFFTGRLETQCIMDWGDMVTPSPTITQFIIGYATDSSTPITIDTIFWDDENGGNSVGRTGIIAYRITGLPGGSGGFGFYSGWIVTLTLAPAGQFGFNAADLDADGLGDFGYSFSYRDIGDGMGGAAGFERHGPLIVAPDPNEIPSPSPGAENVFDRFSDDPNNPPGPNDLRLPQNMLFDGSFWFGGVPFAQFYMTLCTDANGGGNVPACNQPGCEGADIDPAPGLPFGGGDCVVGLADLAVLLGNFGTLSGAVYGDGDIEPPAAGDGDVDLGDLAIMLAAFGTNCN